MNLRTIEIGAHQAVVNCAKVQAGECVVVITDHQTRNMADLIIKQIENLGAEAIPFVMEELGPRPEDGSNPLPFPAIIDHALDRAQVCFYIAQCKPGELGSFRIPMIASIEKKRIRHAHMGGFTKQMMSQGMAADYEQIRILSRKIYDIVQTAQQIHIDSPAGTDLTVQFDPKLKWIISDGYITEDQYHNLPDGEVTTCPKTADGHVVIDGGLGDFFSEKYGLLYNMPLNYDLKNARCQPESVTCSNILLKQEFITYTFETDENSNRLGEFAIGTNIGLTELIGNILQDEKFPGVHLALGNPSPNRTGATWQSKAHCDGIILKPTIIVEGREIMHDGIFTVN